MILEGFDCRGARCTFLGTCLSWCCLSWCCLCLSEDLDLDFVGSTGPEILGNFLLKMFLEPWNPPATSSGSIRIMNGSLFLDDIWAGVLKTSGRKKAHKHKLFALVNVQMALGQTAGCPRVNWAKKFMCSPRNTGNINFSLWLTGGLSQDCPNFQIVYVFKVYPIAAKFITKKLFTKKCFGAINFVKITKESLYKANSLACLQKGTREWQQHYKENLLVEFIL